MDEARTVGLNPNQKPFWREHEDAGARRSGRTTRLALRYLLHASAHPGTVIYIEDHFPSAKMRKYLAEIIDDIVHSSHPMREAFKVNLANQTVVCEVKE